MVEMTIMDPSQRAIYRELSDLVIRCSEAREDLASHVYRGCI